MNFPHFLADLELKYHIIIPLLAKLPQDLAYRLVSLYGKWQLATHETEINVIVEQMQQVFTESPRSELVSWAKYFFCMLEREILDNQFFLKLNKPNEIDKFVKLVNAEALLAARQQGRRVIITTGHFGRLWMAGVALQRHGISVGTITRDGGEVNEYGLPEVEHRYRLARLKALQHHFKGPFLVEGEQVRPIYRALDHYVMGLLIDVPYCEEKKGSIVLPFLGKTARFPIGIAKIAKKTQSLIFPYYVHESRSGLEARFYPALEAKYMDEAQIMQELVSLLESKVLAYPQQWWMWQALPVMWCND